MKTKILAALAITTIASQAAVTITVSNTTSVLTNLVINSGDDNTQRLVWGIIVDGNNNGLQSGAYLGNGINSTVLQSKLGAQILNTSAGATDDVLYLAGSVFSASGTADSSTGKARPLSITNIAMNANGVGTGDAFSLVWFDLDSVDIGNVTTITSTANSTVPNLLAGLKYGVLGVSQALPTDGQTLTIASNYTGADPVRTANFALVPEPSAALLGALGALGLLRRRRN
jgi:hypothetical protein